MGKIYVASETCLLMAEADRVLCHLGMFLPVFLHWIYKMKYSCYQQSFVILGRLVYWVVVAKCAVGANKSFQTFMDLGRRSLINVKQKKKSATKNSLKESGYCALFKLTVLTQYYFIYLLYFFLIAFIPVII